MTPAAIKITFIGLVAEKGSLPFRYLALENLASHLLNRFGDEVDIMVLDTQFVDIAEIITLVAKFSPDYLCISMPIGTVSLGEEVISLCKESCPSSQVVIGNIVATNATAELSARFPDAWIVTGEGELPLEMMVRQHLRRLNGTEALGLGYCFEKGLILNSDIDTIFGGFTPKYWDSWLARGGQALVEGSRGCLGNCSFCSTTHIHANRWTPRPLHSLRSELRLLHQRGVRWCFFVDDDFIGDSWDHALGIGRIIAEDCPGLKFGVSLRADSICERKGRHRLLQLAEWGLELVLLGMESGSGTQLGRFCKRASKEQNGRAITLLKDLGIPFSLGFLLDPLMSLEELRESIEFVRLHRVERQISHPNGILEVHKGTRYEQLAREAGLLRTLDLNTLSWHCSFADANVEVVCQRMQTLEKALQPLHKALTSEFRHITRGGIRKTAKGSLKAMLQTDISDYKFIMFGILEALSRMDQAAHVNTRATGLLSLESWICDVETRYRRLPPILEASHTAKDNLQSSVHGFLGGRSYANLA